MKSIVVMTVTIIAVFAISSDATSFQQFFENLDLLSMVGYGKCPTVETADVEVRFLDSDSSVVKSCATFKFKSRDETPGVKSFSLKFNRSNNDVLRPCASGYDPEIENVLYPCSSTSSTEDDSVNGNVNEVIFGRKFNFSGIQDIRCAMYKMIGPMKYRMAVSRRKSCYMLQAMLSDQHIDPVTSWLMTPDEI